MFVVSLRPTRLTDVLFAPRLRATQSRVGAYFLLLRKTHIITLVIKNNFAIHLSRALLADITSSPDVHGHLCTLIRPRY